MKKELAILGCALMAGCVTSPPRLVNQNDAAVQFSKLGSGGRGIAQTFYDLGAGDSIKRLYWAQRGAQQAPSTAESSPVEKLQRKYLNVPIPAYQDADGTQHEAGLRAVEIVQWMGAITHKGKRINICY